VKGLVDEELTDSLTVDSGKGTIETLLHDTIRCCFSATVKELLFRVFFQSIVHGFSMCSILFVPALILNTFDRYDARIETRHCLIEPLFDIPEFFGVSAQQKPRTVCRLKLPVGR
jgi:hypothetical protein